MWQNLPPRATAALAVLAVFTVWITWRAKALEGGIRAIHDTSKLEGKPAPDFQLQSLDGRTVSLSDFRGKRTVVVSFWASWCGPCRMELPVLTEFYKKTHKPDSNFEIVAISIDEDRSAAQEFANSIKLPFPVLMDLSGQTSHTYGVEGIPMLFVIGWDGKVRSVHEGFDPSLPYLLARDLGIKDYNSLPGAANDASH
jgi:peroxiredoxin